MWGAETIYDPTQRGDASQCIQRGYTLGNVHRIMGTKMRRPITRGGKSQQGSTACSQYSWLLPDLPVLTTQFTNANLSQECALPSLQPMIEGNDGRKLK